MLKFLTRFLAVIGFFTVLGLVLSVSLAMRLQQAAEPEPERMVLTLDLTRPVVTTAEASPWRLAMKDDPLVLLDIVRALDRAKDDKRVKGLVARFGSEQPSLPQAQEIRDALARFRAADKFTYAYGTDFGDFGGGNRAYFLASAFENIWLQPVGTVSLTGVGMQSYFGKSALDKLGVEADFMQREEYKSFMERAQRDGFSPPVKAEMQAMVENLADQVAAGIAENRKWDVAKVKALMEQGPYTDDEARQAGLVTRLAYADELDEELDKKAGKDAERVDVETYLGYREPNGAGRAAATDVALITGAGLIMDKSVGGGGLTGEPVLSADDIAGAFDDAAEDEGVKAILFRVDSPGGSPAASETIRRALTRAQKKGKPVIVSMGDVAASGGYWVAMNGDRIVAQPSTLTGSIGVVSGKMVAGEAMKKWGVSADGVRTADNVGMWDVSAPFNATQRARVNALLDNTYQAFMTNVAAARKIAPEKMPEIAKGRVWTGEQAKKIGLVDELGGYDAALAAVRQTLKLDAAAPLTLVDFPQAPSPVEKIMKFLHRMGAESAAMMSLAPTLAQARVVLQPWLDTAAVAGQPVAARAMMGGRIHD